MNRANALQRMRVWGRGLTASRQAGAATLGRSSRLPAVGAAIGAIVLGAVWTGAALAQNSPSSVAVVSSEKDHALTLVDLATQAVVGTVPTCKRPRHLKVLTARQVVVACGDSGQADVIDIDRRASLRRIGLGEDPEIFDISPDGKQLFVTNEEDAKVGVIEMASGKRIADIAVGEEPEGALLSVDGRTLYVTSEVAGVVHVVDVATRKVVKDVRVGKRPRRMVLAAEGRELWVTNELDASVSIVDTASQSVKATIRFELKGARSSDITPVGLGLSPDGRTAFVALGNANHVAFVDVASRQIRQMVLVGKRAWSVATDRSGARLYVVNGLSDDLTIVDVATAKALKTIKVGRVPHTVVVMEPVR